MRVRGRRDLSLRMCLETHDDERGNRVDTDATETLSEVTAEMPLDTSDEVVDESRMQPVGSGASLTAMGLVDVENLMWMIDTVDNELTSNSNQSTTQAMHQHHVYKSKQILMSRHKYSM